MADPILPPPEPVTYANLHAASPAFGPNTPNLREVVATIFANLALGRWNAEVRRLQDIVRLRDAALADVVTTVERGAWGPEAMTAFMNGWRTAGYTPPPVLEDRRILFAPVDATTPPMKGTGIDTTWVDEYTDLESPSDEPFDFDWWGHSTAELTSMAIELPHDFNTFFVCSRCGWTKSEVMAYRRELPCKEPPRRTRIARVIYRAGWDVVDVYNRILTPRAVMVPHNRHNRTVGWNGRVGDYQPALLPERAVADLLVAYLASLYPAERPGDVAGLMGTIATGSLDATPILADALEEAGFDDAALLAALRYG